MKKNLLLAVFACINLSVLAQTSGDYRSASTGDWNIAGTWEIYNGASWIPASAAPSSTDGIITIQSPHTVTANSAITADQVTIASGATLDKSSSSFTIADGAGTDLTINGTLTVTSNLSGAGTLVVNGTMNWSGGNLSGSVTISALGTLNATQGTKIIAGTTTINGTMNITGDGIVNGGGTLINNGTINKTVVGSAQASIDMIWSNAGTINIMAGELSNTAAPCCGRTFTNTGTINISAGAILSNDGHYIHSGGSMTGSGNFNQSTGQLVINGALTIPASIPFNYSGGTTSGTGTLTATNLAFSGGNIGGTGGLILNGTTTWTGGTFSRTFAIEAGNIINANQGGKLIAGTMTINGTMNITGDGIVNGGGTLINNGTINKTVVGSAQASIDMIWSNAGTINILAGELSNIAAPCCGRSFTNTGTINISAGAILSNDGHYIHNGGSMTGSGNFNQSTGQLAINGALTIPASIPFNYTGGTTTGAGTLTTTDFKFSGGNIGGAGGLILNGTTTWTGGTFTRTFAIAASDIINANQGTKIIAGTMTINGTMNITGDGITNAGGTLINNGTINKTVVAGSVQADIGVPITNSASGIIKGTGTLDFTNTFTNNGTLAPGNSPGLLTVTGAQPFSANSTFAIEVLNNSGPGTGHDLLVRNSNLTLNGTITVTELAIMPLSSYTIINLTSGTITGTFATVNLPYGYTLIIFATSVILNKFSFPLPVSFISFNATKQGRVVSLNWVTDNEINASHFEIERSSDGRTYMSIGNVVSNNIPGIHHYQFTDQSPLQKTNYYRLKQVDIDARHVYSRTEKVDFSRLITVSVSPNPVRNILLIEGAENYTVIRLINMQGILVKQMKGAANLRVDVGNLPAGQYFLRLTGKSEDQTISFLKQ